MEHSCTENRTLVMGILNVTPDSFSDGGRWASRDIAVAHGRQLLAQGADIIDIGGESTRPGATPVSSEVEIARIEDVIAQLAQGGARISVDTMHADTARCALAAGASIVNDVTAGLADKQMPEVVAQAGCQVVLQHWEGGPYSMDPPTLEQNISRRVWDGLQRRIEVFLAAGVASDRIIIDPGLGFAKTAEQCWSLLSELEIFVESGFPVLIGASRKRFLAQVQDPRAVTCMVGRDGATAAVSALAARVGVWAVRVHEIPINLDAVRTAAAWKAVK